MTGKTARASRTELGSFLEIRAPHVNAMQSKFYQQKQQLAIMVRYYLEKIYEFGME